jgi:hypothetical protein
VGLGAVVLGAVVLGAVVLGAVGLGAVGLGAVGLGAVGLGAVGLGAVDLKGPLGRGGVDALGGGVGLLGRGQTFSAPSPYHIGKQLVAFLLSALALIYLGSVSPNLLNLSG